MRFVLALACLPCATCSSRARAPIIAVIQSTGGTEYWNELAHGVRRRAGQYGFVLRWSAPQSPADYGVQARLLNDAVEQHVDGIVLAPSHQLVLAEGVRRAYARGIPVVVVDAPIGVQPSEFVTSIGCSDEAIGFMAAQHFASIGAPLRILTIGSSPTLQSTVQREESMRRALQRFASGVHVVESRYSLSDWARARQNTLDALEADPGINAIFATDEFSSHGVLAAMRSLPRSRPLTVIGVQHDGETQQALRAGLLSMSITCDAQTEGELAMDAMHNALTRRPVEKLIQTEILSFTSSQPPQRLTHSGHR